MNRDTDTVTEFTLQRAWPGVLHTPNAIASDAQAVPQNCNVRGNAGRSRSRHRVLRRSLSHQQPWARCFVFSGAGGVVFYPRECRGRGIWLSKSGLAEFYSRNNGAACSLPTCTLNAAVREQHRRVSFQASPLWLSKSGLYSRINGAACTNAFADELFPGTPSTPILCIATARNARQRCVNDASQLGRRSASGCTLAYRCVCAIIKKRTG